MTRSARAAALLALTAALLGAGRAAAQDGAVVADCPRSGIGDQITRGFYYEDWPGGTLRTVVVPYYAQLLGFHSVTLTARLGGFDGPLIGAITRDFELPDGFEVYYTFPDPSVPAGATIAFSQTAQVLPEGATALFYDPGPCAQGAPSCAACPNLFQTAGTSPPLSSPRRPGVGVAITAPEADGAGAAALALVATAVRRARARG